MRTKNSQQCSAHFHRTSGGNESVSPELILFYTHKMHKAKYCLLLTSHSSNEAVSFKAPHPINNSNKKHQNITNKCEFKGAVAAILVLGFC